MHNATSPPGSFEKTESLARRLGSRDFKNAYGLAYNYVVGGMYNGISSSELVIRLGKARMLGFFGTSGMPLEQVEENIVKIKKSLTPEEAYGINLTYNIVDERLEFRMIELFLKHGVRNVEAAGFMGITPALVYFRLKGLQRDQNGRVVCKNRILAKVSRPEIAEAFMQPASVKIVSHLFKKKLISSEEADLSGIVPVSNDICVTADSGGQTDRGVAFVLFPAFRELKKSIEQQNKYTETIRIGLAGGLGNPQAIVGAFVMGADFVMTGSINQCTVEAGTSKAVKDLLQTVNVQDTDYAPANDMFELGTKVQVLKKGVLFPARANKLYNLYLQYNSIDDVPLEAIEQMEKNYFKMPVSEVWQQVTDSLLPYENSTLERAKQNPKHKMALIFRWYLRHCMRSAVDGDMTDKTNFQIQTGPALGAFNQWVKATQLESWEHRHVDEIGARLMEAAGQLLEENLIDIVNKRTLS